MAVSHAAAAAAGVTLGFAVGTLGFVVAKPKQPGLLSPNDKAVLVGRVAACLGGLAALVFTWNVE